MALGEVTLKQSVYNRIPFIVVTTDNDTFIEQFASETMAELQKSLAIADADLYDESKYSQAKKSLIADMTAMNFIKRKILTNMEGSGTSGVSSTKTLIRAKAGETETEWAATKASEGNRLQASAKDVVGQLMSEAMRKARNLGFILDFGLESEFVINAYSQPPATIASISFD